MVIIEAKQGVSETRLTRKLGVSLEDILNWDYTLSAHYSVLCEID